MALATEIFDKGAIKFGDFTLKSGLKSPVYVDLRVLIDHPDLVADVSHKMWQKLASDDVAFDVLCGVPYAALCYATCLSVFYKKRLLIRRKEAKAYGTKSQVDGTIVSGERCVIVEDVVTTGSSIIEVTKTLRELGLVVSDCIVILDREHGGREKLLQEGITMHSLLSFSEVLAALQSAGRIAVDTAAEIQRNMADVTSIASISSDGKMSSTATTSTQRLQWTKRLPLLSHPSARKLAEVIVRKQTNLCVACDLTNFSDILRLVRKISSSICLLKIHADIIDESGDFSVLATELCSLALEKDFLILADRKFADIGSTVVKQLRGGHYHISSWADFVTAHSVSGHGVLEAIKEGYRNSTRPAGCFLIAEMSSKDALTSISGYKEKTVQMAEEAQHREAVAGFICQSRLSDDSFLYLSPGINLHQKSDGSLGQQFRTPDQAILEDNVDIIIVGRGISEAADPLAAAEAYRGAAWQAYEKAITLCR